MREIETCQREKVSEWERVVQERGEECTRKKSNLQGKYKTGTKMAHTRKQKHALGGREACEKGKECKKRHETV